MAIVNNEKPPYVMFEMGQKEDRNASIEAGHYVAKDVVYIHLTRPGSKDTFVAEAEDWFKIKEKAVEEELYPAEWLEAFKKAYKKFLDGETPSVEGIAIKGWPVLSPGMQKTLIEMGFTTVEALADAPDSTLQKLMGGMAARSKARIWLDEAQNVGVATEKIAALSQKVEELSELTTKLVEENKTLQAALKASSTSAPAKA